MKEFIVSTAQVEDVQDYVNVGASEVVLGLDGVTCGFLGRHSFLEIPWDLPISIDCNRFFFEEELPELESILKQLKDTPVRSIYFSDPSVFLYARKYGLETHLIYNPMTLVTNQYDVAWWLSQGIKAAAVSPLLTEEETLAITHAQPHCEIFLHGYQCMSYSRRKLVSHFEPTLHEKENIYLTEENRTAKMPIYEDAYGTYVYSDFVQTSFEEFLHMKDTEVKRFFIQGLRLPKEAVLDALKAYQAIDEGSEVTSIAQTYRNTYKDLPLSTGYYKEKTVR